MRRLIASLVLLTGIVALALALAGCTKKLTGTTSNTDVPHTTIFVQGPVDTVNHVAHLFWYGTEAHGYIKGYEVRMVNPADTVAADSAWRYTTRTDSVVTVWAPAGYAAPVFYVRAIDSRGVADPNPAKETFQFRNNPPIVTLTIKPNHGDKSDTSFASVTIAWSVSDADGDPSKVVCRVWLDGQQANPVIATGAQFTLPSSRFRNGSGLYYSGLRTLYIQGVDDGGMAGPIDSVTWFVRAPGTDAAGRARVLFVDETLLSDPARARNDTLFSHAVTRLGVPLSQTAYLSLNSNQPFKSATDMAQTFGQFETVVWFRGIQQATFSNVLLTYRDGLGQYLDAGGKVYLESQNLAAGLSSQGSLDAAFTSRYLDSDGVNQYESPPDSSANYGVNSTAKLRCPTIPDSLIASAIVNGLRTFRVRHASEIYISAPVNGLAQLNTFPMAVGLNVPQANNGRLIVNTFPLVAASGGANARAAAVATNVMRQLGLDQP